MLGSRWPADEALPAVKRPDAPLAAWDRESEEDRSKGFAPHSPDTVRRTLAHPGKVRPSYEIAGNTNAKIGFFACLDHSSLADSIPWVNLIRVPDAAPVHHDQRISRDGDLLCQAVKLGMCDPHCRACATLLYVSGGTDGPFRVQC